MICSLWQFACVRYGWSQKASQFLINNAGAIKIPERWDQMKTTHPQIAIKVMEMIVFEKQPLK